MDNNYSLVLNGNNFIKIDIPKTININNINIQLVIKENENWKVLNNPKEYIKYDNNSIIIGKNKAAIVDDILICYKDNIVKYDKDKLLSGNENGVIAYFKINEPEGNLIFDSSKNKIVGEIIGEAKFTNETYRKKYIYDAIIETDLLGSEIAMPKNSKYDYNYTIIPPKKSCIEYKDNISNKNFKEFNIDKKEWCNINGFNLINDKLLISGDKISKFNYDIRLKDSQNDEEVILKNVFDLNYKIDDSFSINSKYLTQANNPYRNIITVYQEDDSKVFTSDDISLYDTDPTVMAFLKGKKLFVSIGDKENDNVRFNIYLNDKKIYPTDSEFTKFQPSINQFEYEINSKLINIDKNNTVVITAEDQYKKQSKVSVNFYGKYFGLLFMDENKKYYSTDLGELLQYLDFGIITFGQSTESKKIIVKNTTGYNLNDINLSVNNTLENINVELSKSNNPFKPVLNESLKLTNNMSDEEEIPFYIRISSKECKKSIDGIFTVIANYNLN